MKTVVITGSTRGIGLGMAREFLNKDCSVAVSSRSADKVEQVVEELGKEFGKEKVLGCPCDVSDCGQVQDLWDKAHEAFGRVDIWINNAGVSLSKIMLWDLSSELVRPVVDTNMTGLMYGCHVAMNGMLAQGGGQIYNFEGHGSNDMIVPGLSTYGGTKRGVRYFTEALSEEAKETPVQIGAIGPGIVITDLVIEDLRNMSEEHFEESKVIINMLADTVETVTPWLVDEVLKNDENGASIQWMTEEKANARFEDPKSMERDLLSQYGL